MLAVGRGLARWSSRSTSGKQSAVRRVREIESMKALWRRRAVRVEPPAHPPANTSDLPDGAPVAPRAITIVGVPHPATRLLFDYLQSVALACPAERPVELHLITSAGVPLAVDPADIVYLRPDAADALHMTTAAAASPADLPLAAALVARLDAAWRHLPSWSIDALMTDPAAMPALLADAFGLRADRNARVREGFVRLGPAAAVYADPAGFLAAVDLAAARRELLVKNGHIHRVGRGGDGVHALAGGWHEPGIDRTPSATGLPRLHLMLDETSRLLVCTFAPIDEDIVLDVFVDGRPAAWVLDRGDGSAVLRVALPAARGGQARALMIELSIGPGERRLDLLTYTVESEAGALKGVRARPIALSRALIASGCRWRRRPIGDAAPAIRIALPLPPLRAIASLLVVAADSDAAMRKIAPSLPADATIAALRRNGGSRGAPIERPEADYYLEAGAVDDLGDPTALDRRFDLIYLHELADRDDPGELIERLIPYLAHGGVIGGAERSVPALQRLLSSLGGMAWRYEFTAIVDGLAWRAAARAPWNI